MVRLLIVTAIASAVYIPLDMIGLWWLGALFALNFVLVAEFAMDDISAWRRRRWRRWHRGQRAQGPLDRRAHPLQGTTLHAADHPADKPAAPERIGCRFVAEN